MSDDRNALLSRYKKALMACGYPSNVINAQVETGKHIDIKVLREYVDRAELRVAGK